MAGFLEPKITKNPEKIDSKRHHKINQFLDRFLIDFSSVLDAKMVPCWPPFSAQDRPRGLPDGSRYSQDALKTALKFPRHPKMLPRRPKTPPRRPKTPPRRLQTSMLADFWSIFWRFLIDFWWILEAKLNQVGMENRAKIDQKTTWKRNEKKKASWRRLGGVLGRLGPLKIH